MVLSKCVFLDRDGVINVERGTYTYKPEDFILIDGVTEAIKMLKENGFKIIVITNQSGISQQLYSKEDMESCHSKMNEDTGGLVDDIFYCRWHPKISESLNRKPDSLMLERAIALHRADVKNSWMIGDKERDIVPAKKVGLRSVLISNTAKETAAELICESLREAAEKIIRAR